MATKSTKTTRSKTSVLRSITIEGICGSELQREIAERTLTELLEIWRREVESRHKKNKITMTEGWGSRWKLPRRCSVLQFRSLAQP